jgi:hypothetical protein
MWYGSTKNLLESIVRGLKNEPPQNDAEWQAQEDLVQGCLAEMVEMRSRPSIRRWDHVCDTFTVRLRMSSGLNWPRLIGQNAHPWWPLARSWTIH